VVVESTTVAGRANGAPSGSPAGKRRPQRQLRDINLDEVTASEDWWRDVLKEGKHIGASGYNIALGEPRHDDVTGDYGYVDYGYVDYGYVDYGYVVEPVAMTLAWAKGTPDA
jgi:hypothetical protein